MSTKRVVDGFSIIIPTLRASLYLDFCLKSIEENSALSNEIIVIVDADLGGNLDENIIKVLQKHTKEYDITYVTNRCNLGPYASWNKGAQLASKDAIAFITDDQFFAPGWDEAIAKFLTPKRLLTCQLVEPGIIRVWRTNIQCDCGSSPRDFNKVKFMNLVLEKSVKRLLSDGFFIPLVMYRKTFFNLGMFPTKRKGTFPLSIPNDVLFVKRALAHGYEFYRVGNSFSYHFQASSWMKAPTGIRRKLILLKNRLSITRVIEKIYTYFERQLILSSKDYRKGLTLIVGCGDFLGCGLAYEDGCFCNNIVALDINAHIQRRNRENSPQANFIVADAQYLPFRDNSFCFAKAEHLLEHVPFPLRVVEEMARTANNVLLVYPNLSNELLLSKLSKIYRTCIIGKIHISYPSLKGILLSLKKYGFDVKAKYTTSKDDGNKLGDFLYLPLKFILIDLLSVDASMDEKRGELIGHKRIDNSKLWHIRKICDFLFGLETFLFKRSKLLKLIVKYIPLPDSVVRIEASSKTLCAPHYS